jgi:CheY-like chemotaxis protein
MAEQPCDCVVLDLRLPDMSGFEVLERIAEDERIADIPVVVFTGRVPHSEVQRYYDLIDVLAYPRHSMRLTQLVTPLKPLEAMAQGRVLIAPTWGTELIDDGCTGLFSAGSVDVLAETICASSTAATSGRCCATTDGGSWSRSETGRQRARYRDVTTRWHRRRRSMKWQGAAGLSGRCCRVRGMANSLQRQLPSCSPRCAGHARADQCRE